MVATGIKTSIIVTLDSLFNNVGIKNGNKNAILKLVTKIDITVNSIFLFNRFIMIGEAIAVGAIAVINATCARVKLNGLINKYANKGITMFIPKI